MGYVQANGIRLYYEQHGEGEDLVLIYGLGGHSGGWRLQVPAFSKHFKVTVFDNRGAGRSDAPDEPYTVQQMAADTVSLLDALEIDRAHIMGMSMGGLIAQEMAINYPDRVNHLVLACTRARASEVRQFGGEAFADCIRRGMDRSAVTLLRMPWVMTPAFMADERKVLNYLEFVQREPYPMKPHAYLRQSAAAVEANTIDRLNMIKSPTLVLVGAEDILTPVHESEIVANGIPASILKVLTRGGHGFLAEYYQEFNEAVLEFLLAK